uniref:Uncharacterized protein n=1 Tax=Anguilla anguilla TaxID=7936 RepID=A0A0E9SHB3_ANGAN
MDFDVVYNMLRCASTLMDPLKKRAIKLLQRQISCLHTLCSHSVIHFMIKEISTATTTTNNNNDNENYYYFIILFILMFCTV